LLTWPIIRVTRVAAIYAASVRQGVIFQASLTPRGGVAEWTVQALEVTLAAVAKAAVRATAGFEFEQPLARPSFR
jgi:hypothetical protein